MVDFAMFPHLDHEAMPDNFMADAERWAASVLVPGYAIDDQTTINVVDDTDEPFPRQNERASFLASAPEWAIKVMEENRKERKGQ